LHQKAVPVLVEELKQPLQQFLQHTDGRPQSAFSATLQNMDMRLT
jgi:hypothetical protein